MKQLGSPIRLDDVRARSSAYLNVRLSYAAAQSANAAADQGRMREETRATGPSATEMLNTLATLRDLFRAVASRWSDGAVTTPRSRNATSAERDAWASFLRTLAADEKLTEAQRNAALDIWQRAIETEPNVMYPTVGIDREAGSISFSWNPRPLSLEIEIEGDGRLEWHFADYETGSVDGSSEPQPELEPKARTFLRLFRRAEEGGRASAQR